MSCSQILESDPVNGRTVIMWAECGIQFRSNLIDRIGGKVELHSHSYDHKALIRGGSFEMVVGEQHSLVKPGDLITVKAGDMHGFVCFAKGMEPAEVLCFWGDN